MNAPPVDITCTVCSPQEPTALISNSQNCLKLRNTLNTKGSLGKHQRILPWKSPFSFKMFLERPAQCKLHWWCSSGTQSGSSVVLNLKNMSAVWSVVLILLSILLCEKLLIYCNPGLFCILGIFCSALCLSDDFFFLILGNLQMHENGFIFLDATKEKLFYVTNIKRSCLKCDRCFYWCRHRLIFVNLLMEAVHQTHLWQAHIRSPAATKPQTEGPFRKLQAAVFAWEVV